MKRRIDIHAHLRDEEQSYKSTIAEGIELALSQGVEIVADMPNPERPVTNANRAFERLALVSPDKRRNYRLWLGLTGEEAQTHEAVWCHRNIDEVIGLKMFAGKSVGSLSITDMVNQRMVYHWLSDCNFEGVVGDHCEKEALLRPDLWNPANPISHCWARPKEAEIESVKDQIRFAFEEKFTGWLHVCHVSCPESVVLVAEARASGLHISCGVTPHHVMWDNSMMYHENGLIYKMNPPLRSTESVSMLRNQLVAGMIDVIETDHAPHALTEKMGPPYLSGYPSLELYSKFVTKFLPKLGLSQEQIKAMTRDNILRIFGDKLKVAA